MKWSEIDSGVLSADAIMHMDSEFLRNLQPDSLPTIHFYEWQGNSATYGYFIDPYRVLNREGVIRNKLQIARRPTGGGIIFHLTDFAFSILIPASHPMYSLNTLDNYRFINHLIAQAIQPLAGKIELLPEESIPLDKDCSCFCMAKPTRFDIMQKGCKVGGASQRRTKMGFLHQGSLSLTAPPIEFLEEVLLPGNRVAEAMQQNSFFLFGPDLSNEQLLEARLSIKSLLRNFFFLDSQ